MILSRRKAHWYASITLAVALPIVFLAGLVFRPGTPTVDESVDELFAIANFSTDISIPDDSEAQTLSNSGIQLQVATTEVNNQLVLDVQPMTALQVADILVYWQSGAPEIDTAASASDPNDTASAPATDAASDEAEGPTISETAVLLGQLAGDRRRQFPLPATIQGQSGSLILYSRGQSAVLATFPLEL